MGSENQPAAAMGRGYNVGDKAQSDKHEATAGALESLYSPPVTHTCKTQGFHDIAFGTYRRK